MPIDVFRLDLSRFDAAIVDLDGTMVDTLGDFVAAINRMLVDLRLPPIDSKAIETRIGKGSDHLIRSVLEHAPATAAQAQSATDSIANRSASLFDQAYARYQHHYLEVNGQHAPLYPGVAEGLEALRAHGLELACLTNKPTAFAIPLLAAKQLDGYFSHVFGGDAFERKKPDPLPLLKTCEALGTQPARTLMIGDSSNDARAARAAGCPVMLVTYGYNHGEPVREVDADGFVDSLCELTAGKSPVPRSAGLQKS